MGFFQRLFLRSAQPVQSTLDSVAGKIPFEVVGRSEEGKRVHEVVWARGVHDARELVARLHGIGNRFLVNAYELLKDQTGGIAYASDGRPMRKWE